MTKTVTRVSAVVMLAGAVGFGLLWLNNLAGAVRFHCRLNSGVLDGGALAASWCPELAWSAVDVSTVTTFIPFFGFVLMLRGVCRIRRNEEWPFFAGYERLNIALGLLGTVWGIILVGYYPPEEISIASLMQCLHTAMFSTLAAVGWVMVVLPLAVRPWMNSLRRMETGAAPEDEALDEIAGNLLADITRIGGELQKTAAAASEFQAALGNGRAELSALAAAAAAGREAEAAWRREAVAGVQAFAALAGELHIRQEALNTENRRLTEQAARLEADLGEARTQLAELQRRMDAVREVLR